MASCLISRQQGIGQGFSLGFGRSNRQQVDIGIGIPVAACQGAEQPHLGMREGGCHGPDSLAQGAAALAAALLANGGQSGYGVRLGLRQWGVCIRSRIEWCDD